MDRDQVLSRRAVESMIAEGKALVIFKGLVLRLDQWLSSHPGGVFAIKHMVGRDATDEMTAYHSLEIQRHMPAYRIGKVEGQWTNFTPPIRGGVFRKIGSRDEAREDSDTDNEKSLTDSESTSASSQNTSRTSIDSTSPIAVESIADPQRIKSALETTLPNAGQGSLRHRNAESSVDEDSSHVAPIVSPAPNQTSQSRADFISECIQKEIDEATEKYPSLDAATQEDIRRKYAALHERVKNEGYYQCRYWEYGKECIRYSIFFAAFIALLRAEWYTASAIALGVFWQQIMFSAHDAGHHGITHNSIIDNLIGIFIGDFCCGLSVGWWKSSHNVHHLVTNLAEHDPDIQNVPVFAICPTMFKSVLSSYYDFFFAFDHVADFMVPFQKYTYYPIMIIARFNLYFLSWVHLMSPRSANLGSAQWTRPAEIAAMCCYWYLFGYCLLWCSIPTWGLRLWFVLVSHVATSPLHVQITLSHWATSTADLGDKESFPQRQVRTTMDIDCPEWLDWIHGGLQHQIAHHLFPRVPRHNLRKLSGLVREFCKDTGIEYTCYGWVEGNKVVLSRLDQISRQVEMLIKCQAYMAETGESGLH